MLNTTELWADCYSSSMVKERPYPQMNVLDKRYYGWDRGKAQALFAWRIGAFKFKTSWRIYNVSYGVGTACVMSMCPHEDEWNHMIRCKFYHTKWNDIWMHDEEKLAEFIVKMSRERMIRVKMPLF